ncbi:MAG TPA: ATP-binding protein [Ramlibacter sp.]|jgi:signal transduction histidine kinase/ActR/RegA family two-component response regulator|uniref:hybrid sensor histidine kinase/response regulator n=1 Tax=Ramlibacter sp. TaxID=1917967 RepID=UPI002D31BB87|nr:ATP-binding protein [Ramlibacter sp.]HZY17845.1 ATP-binding protein [Ramlibacter sp.]
MGLLALPALWAGKDGQTVLQIMVDAACTIVPASAVLAVTSFPPDDRPVSLMKVGPSAPEWRVPAPWQAFATACEHELRAGRLGTIASPAGPLTVLHLQMGAGRHRSDVWFGSADPSFPTANHVAFLRAAASLGATGLSAARTEYERARAQRAKDEFLAMLGHELRNPLAPIVTTLGIIRIKGRGQLDREHEVIERQVGHLSRLVDDLLDITRITRNRIELRKEVFDLHQAVLEALEAVAPLVEERQHHVALEAQPGQYVEADRSRMRQVVANLLINAAKYTPPGGRLQVQVAPRGGAVQVVVQDNGIGIDAALLPRVFDLFEQGSTSIDRARGGLGIGLAIVQKLVTLHGGTVQAHSEGTGRGSRFTFTLPLVEQSPVATSPATCTDAVGQGRRVLLVDDNADALDSLEALLAMNGFEVVTARDPAQALVKSASFEADAFVLDIGLPGMDGYQLAEELRRRGGARLASARFIALTGYGQESDRARAMQARFDHHMVKPVDIQKLLEVLSPDAAEPPVR